MSTTDWRGAPGDTLGCVVPIQQFVAQTSRAVIALQHAVAFREGCILNLRITVQRGSSDEAEWDDLVEGTFNPGMALNAIPGFRCVVLCGVVGGFRVLLSFCVVAGSPRVLEVRSAMAPAATMTYDRIRDPINPPATNLLPEFRQNGGRYFNTDERDFVAVYSR